MGYNNDKLCIRFHQDALEFYKKDIRWFTQIFVMIILHILVIFQSIVEIKGATEGHYAIVIIVSSIFFISRCAQLYFFVPLLDEKR